MSVNKVNKRKTTKKKQRDALIATNCRKCKNMRASKLLRGTSSTVINIKVNIYCYIEGGK